jgi:tetrahydromethanopterin S-methyltransferase subunit A
VKAAASEPAVVLEYDAGDTESVSVVVVYHAAHALEFRVRAASITIAGAKLI